MQAFSSLVYREWDCRDLCGHTGHGLQLRADSGGAAWSLIAVQGQHSHIRQEELAGAKDRKGEEAEI